MGEREIGTDWRRERPSICTSAGGGHLSGDGYFKVEATFTGGYFKICGENNPWPPYVVFLSVFAQFCIKQFVWVSSVCHFRKQAGKMCKLRVGSV